MQTLDGKVIVVTGGAAGIGREMVLGLARAGARVLAADISGDAIASLDRELAGTPLAARVRSMRIDLAQPGSGEVLVEFARRELGPIHGLVNNAGIGRSVIKEDIFRQPPRFWEMSEAIWERFLAINASAAFRTMKAAVAAMVQQGEGRIVNVTTSLDSMLNAGAAGYGPSKAAAESLCAIAAADLRGTGVVVNVLIPGGPVDTAMIPANAPFERRSLLSPQCMVAPLCWLMSDAAREVTAVRIQAHLWRDDLPGHEALGLAAAPIAWTSLSGQLRKPATTAGMPG